MSEKVNFPTVSRGRLPVIQSGNQAAQHPCDFLKIGLEFAVHGITDHLTPSRKFQQRHAFLNRTACDPKEVPAVPLGESSLAFGDVRGD